MANPEISNNDPRKLEVFAPIYEHGTLEFAGADELVEGTIMAQVAASAGAVTPDGGNTGDGTVTGFSLAAGGPPKVGDWNLECVLAVTNGGEFKLEDPDGNLVASPLRMTAGAGAATEFTVAGMTFIITDGATDFIAGDKFALTVADEGHNWVPYDADGLNGSQYPRGVLPEPITVTGAATPHRSILIEGEVYEDKLVIDAGGTVGEALIAALRSEGIIARSSVELRELDNQ
jgi:hypothetical protein